MEKGAVGDIRIFSKHSLIEVDASVAPQLLDALATATVCGYEVNVREDKGTPEYSEGRVRPAAAEVSAAATAETGTGATAADSGETAEASAVTAVNAGATAPAGTTGRSGSDASAVPDTLLASFRKRFFPRERLLYWSFSSMGTGSGFRRMPFR